MNYEKKVYSLLAPAQNMVYNGIAYSVKRFA